MAETKTNLSPEERLLIAVFGEAKGSYPPRNEVDGVTLKEAVSLMLSELTPRERRVLHLRFGFGGIEALTLKEVGGMFGVTRERIRQIEGKALRKLKHPTRTRRLKPYLVELGK